MQVNASDVHAVTRASSRLGVALGVLGSTFAALRPAIAASRVQPVEALRRDLAAGADSALRKEPIILGLLAAWRW